MEGLTVLAIVVAVFALLGALADSFGVDSRAASTNEDIRIRSSI